MLSSIRTHPGIRHTDTQSYGVRGSLSAVSLESSPTLKFSGLNGLTKTSSWKCFTSMIESQSLQYRHLPEHQGLKSTTRVPRVVLSLRVSANSEYLPTGASTGGVTDRVTIPLCRLALWSILYFHMALTSLVYIGDGLPNSERVPRFSEGAGPGEDGGWG